jgi:hypothetical protein
MPAYQRLGNIRLLGQSDSTAGYSFNPFLPATGWDVLVNASTAKQSAICISGQWPLGNDFECYQIHLDGPVGASVLVMINRQPWNFVLQGWQNYDDPQQPMELQSGDEVQFAWTVAATAGPYTPSGGNNVQPVVTMWLRQPLA